MPVSPHGLAIALLQLAGLIALLAVAPKWAAKRRARGLGTKWLRPLLAALLALEYVALRIQPIRMGGDPFAYTLGIFDGVTALALILLLLPATQAHATSAPAPSQ